MHLRVSRVAPDHRALPVERVGAALRVLEHTERGVVVLRFRDLVSVVADAADDIDGGGDVHGVFERERPGVLLLLLHRLVERRVSGASGGWSAAHDARRCDRTPRPSRCSPAPGPRRTPRSPRTRDRHTDCGNAHSPTASCRSHRQTRRDRWRRCCSRRLRLHVRRWADLRLRQERRVLHVPVGPAPVGIRRHRRIIVDVQRRALLAELLDEVQRVFVRVVRRPSRLQVVAGIDGVRTQALARRLQRVGRRRVVARERPRIAIRKVDAALRVEPALARANHHVPIPSFGLGAAARPDASLNLERLRRLCASRG